MGSCKRMLLAFIFLIEANFLALAQISCFGSNGNYTGDNSTYRANLNAVLSTLITNLDNNGFSNASLGQSPDRANAIIFCRGDLQPDECRSCAQNASIEVVKGCPIAKQATIWNWEEKCTLRYSNETILGKMMALSFWSYSNPQNATNPEQFERDLTMLMDDLRDQAANGGPLRKVAADDIMTAPDFQPIYAMLQCTPDLSSRDCKSCLAGATGEIIGSCKWNIGCRLLKPSCTLRFETYRFYNETRLQELEAPVPAGPGPVPAPQLLSPPPPSGKANGNKIRTIIIIVVSIVASSILAVLVVILLRKKIKRNPMEKLDSESVNGISTVESLQYTFSTIKLATNAFSDDNKLGQGGFGAVYKGILSNGREIAVKRLSKNSGQGILEFKNEVLLLAKLQHRNLVRLLGFCLEGTEKLLVYEYVQNASLDFFIFDRINHPYLDWERRYKIIKGIARGILYLHEDSRLRIIHRDLKASNVLLDGDMNPKIADFGMARLFGQDETQGNTNRIVGTYGYMAPEYAIYGQFSIKSDVFSFGMLVLEIISGQRNYFRCGENAEHLLSFAWKNWREGTSTNIVDPFLRSDSGSMSDILRCINMGLLCVQENAADRPTMASVVLMLSSSSLTMAIPSEPAFYMASGNDSEDVLMQEYISRDLENNNSSKSNKATHSGDSSNNDASITELYPR